MPQPLPPPSSRRMVCWSFVALMLAAFNLRLALTAVSPVLPLLGQSLGLGDTGLSWLTTLPVLLMGLAAPLAPTLMRRWSAEAVVLALLLLLALSQVLRPWAGAWGFLLGTAVAGASIGVLGVLLPALVKRDFAAQASWVTGIYTMVLSVGAALAAGVVEPLRLAWGGAWQWPLALWAVPAVLAMPLWWFLRAKNRPVAESAGGQKTASATPAAGLLRQPLAWYVTAFMGLQSALAYSIFGWLPSMLVARGMAAVQAGLALSVLILVSTVGALFAPGLSAKMRDERGMNTLTMLCYVAGMAGCWLAPLSQLWLWASVLGMGLGGGFAMALALLALRAPDVATAGRLSAMAQGFGYGVAALGPLGLGLLQAHWGWVWGLGFLEAIALLSLLAGLGAGRKRLLPTT